MSPLLTTLVSLSPDLKERPGGTAESNENMHRSHGSQNAFMDVSQIPTHTLKQIRLFLKQAVHQPAVK